MTRLGCLDCGAELTQADIESHNCERLSAQQKKGEFKKWWQAYPKNAGGRKPGKQSTWTLFKKLKAEDYEGLMQATKNYAEEVEGTPFVRHPQRFLKADFWRDYVRQVQPVSSTRADREGLQYDEIKRSRLFAHLEALGWDRASIDAELTKQGLN